MTNFTMIEVLNLESVSWNGN